MGPGENHYRLLGVANHFPHANQRACGTAAYPEVGRKRLLTLSLDNDTTLLKSGSPKGLAFELLPSILKAHRPS